MQLTCAQMDVLISFYIDGDLSKSLKKQVEEHLKVCSSCKAKYEIINSMVKDIKSTFENKENSLRYSGADFRDTNNMFQNEQYRAFRNSLSAYVDNELTNDDSIKVKKITITNPQARKDLRETYNLRRLIKDSFQKTRDDCRQDVSKSIVKQIHPSNVYTDDIHPIVKFVLGSIFCMSIVAISIWIYLI